MGNQKEFQERIKGLVKEFEENLKKAVLTGYSFYTMDIKKDSNGFRVEAAPGLKMILNGEEVNLGADIIFERGTRFKEHAKMYINYELSCGRDYRIQFHDECSNTPGNVGSIQNIRVTDNLFEIIYQMTNPLYIDSPMPMM